MNLIYRKDQMNHTYTASFMSTLLTCLYFSGCATTSQISYQRDVYPIFVDKCIDCHTPPHGEGFRKTGLDMESYETLMEGSIFGPVVVPGHSETSTLNMFIEGRAGALSSVLKNMHNPITDHEIMVLHLWVEQGARNN
jgi:hypothetical protein